MAAAITAVSWILLQLSVQLLLLKPLKLAYDSANVRDSVSAVTESNKNK